MQFTDNITKIIRKPEFLRVLYVLVPLFTFFLGLVVSPYLLQRGQRGLTGNTEENLADTVRMYLPDGSIYEGSISAETKERQGYGKLTLKDGTIFEGEWRQDHLPYGTRTTESATYVGRFDKELNLHGFGIIEYSEKYVKGKQSQGFEDRDITKRYIGNWQKNNKQGLGRSTKCDGTMEFGNYSKGVLQKVEGANYKIGGSVYGIDVSHHQADINWDKMALSCDNNGNVLAAKNNKSPYLQPVFFCYMKATEGATVKDNTYSIRMIEAQRHGIAPGAYHFLHIGTNVDMQVMNFLETATWTPGDMPPALDVEIESEFNETGTEQSQKIVLEWLEKVEKKLGVRPIIYTRESIRNKYLNDARFEKYDFWIARYSENQPNNFDWLIWQKTDKGYLNGTKGHIDINLFKSNYSSFVKYLEKNT